ncbi:TPA: helix-turn-helix transcriptional regulator, partial [Enterococcus faecium]|nr:helix-turn-helix transcriptional regulator [Enterococcus faecium]
MNGGENVARKKYPEAVETGQRIRLARIEKGLSMEQLGGKLSPPASKGAVSNWENGYNLPNNTRLKQLSKVLDVSTTYLLNGSY